MGGAVAVPGDDTVRQDVLNCASVKVCEGFRCQDKFLQPLEVEEALLRLLHLTVCLGEPFQFISDVYVEELKTSQLLNCCPIDVDRGVLPLLFPEFHVISFVFVDVE